MLFSSSWKTESFTGWERKKSHFKIILCIPLYTMSIRWKHSRILPAAPKAMGFLLKEEVMFSLDSAVVPADQQHMVESGSWLCFAPLQMS